MVQYAPNSSIPKPCRTVMRVKGVFTPQHLQEWQIQNPSGFPTKNGCLEITRLIPSVGELTLGVIWLQHLRCLGNVGLSV